MSRLMRAVGQTSLTLAGRLKTARFLRRTKSAYGGFVIRREIGWYEQQGDADSVEEAVKLMDAMDLADKPGPAPSACHRAAVHGAAAQVGIEIHLTGFGRGGDGFGLVGMIARAIRLAVRRMAWQVAQGIS